MLKLWRCRKSPWRCTKNQSAKNHVIGLKPNASQMCELGLDRQKGWVKKGHQLVKVWTTLGPSFCGDKGSEWRCNWRL